MSAWAGATGASKATVVTAMMRGRANISASFVLSPSGAGLRARRRSEWGCDHKEAVTSALIHRRFAATRDPNRSASLRRDVEHQNAFRELLRQRADRFVLGVRQVTVAC